MSKGIQLSAIKALDGGGPVLAWVEYPYIDGFELRIEFLTADDESAFYSVDGGKAREVTDDEFRDWHINRVKAWRGVYDGESPAALDRAVLKTIWQKDGRFRTWLIGRCRHLGSFLGGADEAPALALGDDSGRAAA